MNASQTNSPTPIELTDEIVALRHQIFTLLLALIVVSGTLTVYLYRQARVLGNDIEAIKPQARQIIQAARQGQQGMETFVNQLVAYGQTHPDFQQQVLKKYNLVPHPTAAAPATTAPVPAATPAPKPKK